MPHAILSNAITGSYRVMHKPDQRPDRSEIIDVPVFVLTERKPSDYGRHEVISYLIHLQFGMGSGPWIVMKRHAATGKASRLRNSGDAADREAAVSMLRALAASRGWVEVA